MEREFEFPMFPPSELKWIRHQLSISYGKQVQLIKCWKEFPLMSKEFGNDKSISNGRASDGICDKDGKTHEMIQ